MTDLNLHSACGQCGSQFLERIEGAEVGNELVQVALLRLEHWETLHQHVSSGVGGRSLRDDEEILGNDFIVASNRMRDRLFTQGALLSHHQYHPAIAYWSDLLDQINEARRGNR